MVRAVHAIVVGCGRVGKGLAMTLQAAGHTVAVIDKQERALGKLPASFEGDRILGLGFDRTRLEEAGIQTAAALAAVTSGDNSNIVVARIAREQFGVGHVVARIYDPARAVFYRRLGIPTVATVEWATDQVLRYLIPDEGRAEWVDPKRQVAMVERALPGGWVGHPLGGLEEAGRIRLVVLLRGGEVLVPEPGTVGQDLDVLRLAVTADALEALEAKLVAAPVGGHA